MKQRVVALFMAVLLVLSASSVFVSAASLPFRGEHTSVYGGNYIATGEITQPNGFEATVDWTNTAGKAYIHYTTYTRDERGNIVPARSDFSSKTGYQASLDIDIPTTTGGYVLVQVKLNYYSKFMDNETIEFANVILSTGY